MSSSRTAMVHRSAVAGDLQFVTASFRGAPPERNLWWRLNVDPGVPPLLPVAYTTTTRC